MRRASLRSTLTCLLLLSASCGGPASLRQPGGEPPRVVSLAPSVSDILGALGASDRLVGSCAVVRDRETGRGDASGIPTVAAHGSVDTEAVVRLRPSFCATVVGMQDPQSLADIRRLGVEVVEYPMEDLGDLWACMGDLGRRAGLGSSGEELAAACRRRVALCAPAPGALRPAALVVVGTEPTVVAGEGTFLDDLLTSAGFRNAASPLRGYPQLDLEAVIRSRAELLVYPEGDLPEGAAESLAGVLKRVAGRGPALLPVPADCLVRPGPGSVDAAERLARWRESSVGKAGAP